MRLFRPRRWLGATVLTLLAAVSPGRAAAQQAYTLVGSVVDASTRAPLSDVNVQLRVGSQGTGPRTTTDAAGRFTLRATVAPGTYTLNFSQIGRGAATRTLTLAGDAAVQVGQVELATTVLQLEEVVVTGTGAPVERRELGNTVASVSGDAISQAPGAQTVDQALQGKVAGALITENSGQPGGGVSIRLRGTNTILGNAEPLIVIDGVIINNTSEALIGLGANATRGNAALTNRLSDIPPGDIERVEVLKGAAAAALYGSRANAGVIQIFTKRGRQGRPQVTFRTEVQAASTDRRLDLNRVPLVNRGDVAANPALKLGDSIARFDIQDQVFRTGYGTSNELSISGGSEGTSYYMSGQYSDEEGILKATDFSRMSGRARVTQRVSDWLEVGTNITYLRSRTNLVPEGEQTQGILTSIIFTPTYFNPAFNTQTGAYPYNPILGNNPFDIIENWIAQTQVTRFLGNVQATATPLSNLTITYLAGLDDGRQEDTYLQPRGARLNFTGEIQNPIRQARQLNSDLTANYESSVAGMGLTSTAGMRYTEERINTVRAAASELAPGQRTITGAVQVASQGISEQRTLGGFIQERLEIAERIFLTGGLNLEGSSAFGRDVRWQMYPRISGSWVVDEQPGFATGPLGRALTGLRVRAAYGETGGPPPGSYLNQVTYVNVNYGGRPGLRPNLLEPNPDLRPERQREWEAGFDASALNDRVSLEFSYYDKVTKDVVLNLQLAPTSGFQSGYRNVGTISNRGVELSLNTQNVQRPGFSWNTRLLYARNRNSVDQLYQGTDTLFFPGGGYPNAVIKGQPIGVFYGVVYQRDAQGNRMHTGVGPSGGSVPRRYRTCVRPAGCPALADSSFVQQIIGDPNPDFTASLQNTFNVSGLEIGVLLDGRFGNDVMNFTRRSSDFFGSSPRAGGEALGDTIVGTYARNAERNGLHEEYVEDGSFVKLREVALGYRFDAPWVRLTGASEVGLRLAARNLHTWTNYSGLDPEVNMFSAHTVARGLDFATTPIPRTIVLSLDFNF
jgi:TonB-linked SusC/RagA family outer membrane protein